MPGVFLKLIFLTVLLIGINCVPDEADESYQFQGKPSWQPMLEYTFALHQKSTHPKEYPFPFEWEEIGPGYCYGPAFGHWDIIHQVFDALEYDPDHALKQLYNNIANQEASGLLPGSIWMPDGKSERKRVEWNRSSAGHPPVWVVAADEMVIASHQDKKIVNNFYQALIRQITWFENKRKAEGEGFFYTDILYKLWESGVDEGVRFDEVGMGRWACVDATSHVYMLYEYAEKWAQLLGIESGFYNSRKLAIKQFINDSLYSNTDGMYFDHWAMKEPHMRHYVIENFWPMIAGVIPKVRADDLIDNYLLNQSHFLTSHPVPSVSVSDPKFELRMWRGPAWNSITYWIALGCMKYDRLDAARIILERALDSSAGQFARTGTVWEFYHPQGGNQKDVKRKPQTKFNTPCEDYLGHNPLIAMTVLYDQALNDDLIKSDKE